MKFTVIIFSLKKIMHYYIYCAYNISNGPNVYKLGFTKNLKQRFRHVFTDILNGCEIIYFIEVQDGPLAERYLFSLLKQFRVRPDREFFELDIDKIKLAMDHVYQTFQNSAQIEESLISQSDILELNISKREYSKKYESPSTYCLNINEEVPIKRIQQVLKSDIFEKTKSDIHWKVNDFSIVLNLFQFGGVNKRCYTLTKNDDDVERLNCSLSLQNCSSNIRAYLLQDTCIEIHIENCHPLILLDLMNEDGVTSTHLNDYCHNRENWIQRYGQTFELKVLSQINDDKLYLCDSIDQQQLFTEIYNYVKPKSSGGKIFHLLAKKEQKLLEKMVEIAQNMDIRINAFIDNGLIIFNTSDLELYLSRINAELPTFKVTVKRWEVPVINILDTSKFDYSDPITFCDLLKLSGKTYDSVNHFYLKALPLILKTCRMINGILFTKKPRSSISDSYSMSKSIKKDEFVVDIGRKLHFNQLIAQFASLITYDNLSYSRYPGLNEFSLEPGFLCEYEPLPDDWEQRIVKFKQHILEVNSNNDPNIAEGFYYWYANMIQTETQSQFIIVNTGHQDCGKSIIPSAIIKYILGTKGLIVGTFAEVTAKFNSILAGKRFILVNEMSNTNPKHKHTDINLLKNLIESPVINIVRKGLDKTTATNFIEFMGCSNHDNCISQSDGMERRNFIVKASNKYVGNHQYFDELSEYFRDPRNIRSIFEFLRTYDLTKNPHLLRELPMTENKLQGLWWSINSYIKACIFVCFDKKINDDTVYAASHNEIWDMFVAAGFNIGPNFSKKKMTEYLKGQLGHTIRAHVPHFKLSRNSLGIKPEIWNLAYDDFIEFKGDGCVF